MVRPVQGQASAAVFVERFFQAALLGLVASGYLAVAGSGYLDTPTVVLTAAGLVLRAFLVSGLLRLEIPDRFVNFATIAYTVFFGVDYFLLSREFLPATVHLVFFLAVMKILTAKTSRDYLYTAIIAFLELLAAAILSVNLNFFLFLALFLFSAMAALTSAEIRRSTHRSSVTARTGLHRFHPRLAFLAAFVTMAILSLTAALFFVLPRTADAAFAGLLARRIYIPGFSNQVTLGEIGEVKTTSRPIMHVRIFGDVSPNLKWRGAALSEFDGRRWSNPPGDKDQLVITEGGHAALVDPDFRDTHPGRRVNYQVDLNAIDTDALFFIGTPESLDLRHPSVMRTATGGYRLGHAPPQGLRYDAWSLLEPPPGAAAVLGAAPVLPLEQRRRYLQLPALDPRIAPLAARMTEGAASDLDRALALERRLHTDYGYTLQLLPQEVRDPLAHFLFVRKQGHCEYFASAMAVMLRVVGISSRMVTGFQSGVWNPISELYVVRASDAHSWVEAWIPGRGWTTFDPTPPDPNPRTLSLFAKAALYLDAAETFWKDWVVSYDLNRQGTLADSMEQGARRMGIRWFDSFATWATEWRADTGRWLRSSGWRVGIAGLCLVPVLLLIRPVWRMLHVRRRVRRVRRGRAQTGDATLLYARMLHILRRRGYQKPPWLTPREFASTLPPGPARELVGEFTLAYNAVRFGGRIETAPHLSLLLDQLERQER